VSCSSSRGAPPEVQQQLQQLMAALGAGPATAGAGAATAGAAGGVGQAGGLPAAEVRPLAQQQEQEEALREGMPDQPSTNAATPASWQQQQQHDHQPAVQQQPQQGNPSAPHHTDSTNSTSSTRRPAPAAAAAAASRVLLQHSSHVPSLVSAAVMEHRAGNTAAAQQLYSRALLLEPHNPKLLHCLAQMLLKEGDRQGALQHLAVLEGVDPGNGYLCHTKGLLAQQEGRLDEARAWFERGTRETCECVTGWRPFGRGLSGGKGLCKSV